MKKIALFISGSGGNAVNLARACRDGRVPAEAILGVASKPGIGGIEKLRAEGLHVEVLDHRAHESVEAFSKSALALAERVETDFIVLAGWLRRLFIPPIWEGRIVNIHPGLLPRYGGPGMYGLNVHRAVLAAHESESGCTVHLVDNEWDHGRKLAEQRVPVFSTDTPESLQQRVYVAELELYPKAVAEFICGKTHT